MTDDTRFFKILEKIEKIEKCVNRIRIDLDTHVKVHDEIYKKKLKNQKSNREKIAIIISIIATTIAFFSIIPSLFK